MVIEQSFGDGCDLVAKRNADNIGIERIFAWGDIQVTAHVDSLVGSDPIEDAIIAWNKGKLVLAVFDVDVAQLLTALEGLFFNTHHRSGNGDAGDGSAGETTLGHLSDGIDHVLVGDSRGYLDVARDVVVCLCHRDGLGSCVKHCELQTSLSEGLSPCTESHQGEQCDEK